MSEENAERSAALQQIEALAQALYDAIDSGDPQHILAAQKNLTAAAEVIWSKVERSPIQGQDKAIARLLAEAAIKELPTSIQDSANYPRIQSELRLMKRSLLLLP